MSVQPLSDSLRAEIDHSCTKYPPEQRRSSILVALQGAQHENNGYLTKELMDSIADYLDLTPIDVYEVASFYSMLETEPCGRHSVSVCNNISCMLRGADEIVAHLEKKLDIKRGESTADGRIHLKAEEECLAACVGAPMMMVDHVYHVDLTPEKVDAILDTLE